MQFPQSGAGAPSKSDIVVNQRTIGAQCLINVDWGMHDFQIHWMKFEWECGYRLAAASTCQRPPWGDGIRGATSRYGRQPPPLPALPAILGSGARLAHERANSNSCEKEIKSCDDLVAICGRICHD